MNNRWNKSYQKVGRQQNTFKPRWKGNFNSRSKLYPAQTTNQEIGGENRNLGNPTNVSPIDVQDETLLCLSYGQGLLGAAVYEQSNKLVRLMYDISEDQEFCNIRRVIEATNPSIIIVNSNQDLNFINWLTARYDAEDAPNDDEETSTSVQKWEPSITEDRSKEVSDFQSVSEESDFEDDNNVKLIKLPNSFFRYAKGMQRINESMIQDDNSLNTQEKLTILKMRLNVDSVNTIRAFGCLLFYLDDCRLGVESKPLNVKTPIMSITTFVLENHVEIDFNSFIALNIFSKNPGFKKGGRDQDNLFHLMNKCNSSVGQKLMRKWFLNPTTNKEILRSRQRCIHFFSQDCNIDVTVKLMRLLKNITGLNHIFNRFQAGTAELIHWNGFIKTMTALSEIAEIIDNTSVKNELIENDFKLKDLSELIVIAKSIIDFDDSLNEGRVTICAGVDSLLDEYRNTYRSLPSVLTAIAEQEAKRLGMEHYDNCSCIYVPLLGYLLSLPNTFRIAEHPNMTLVYKTDTEIRVKNEMTARLEEEVGDIRMQIIDKETAILLRLKKLILTKRRQLISLLSVAAKVDVLISFARVACEMGWNCPCLVDQPVLEAIDLYHPLSERVTKKEFVPNNLTSGSDGTKVSIITGPNACGKSMYMKEIGLLAFLCHIGSFVPAKKAVIGPIDRIMTRLFTLDTVLDGMSTFAKDVEQVAIAVEKATANSLVIIDEFGKGTMTEVGLSLLASCISHWIKKGPDECPHLFVSSHFHALPKYIQLDNAMVSFLTFRVHRLSGGRIEYLYKLVEGLVDCSFAMAVAKESGIQMKVIERACEVYDWLKNRKCLGNLSLINPQKENDFLEISMEQVLQDENFIENVNKLTSYSVDSNESEEEEEAVGHEAAEDNGNSSVDEEIQNIKTSEKSTEALKEMEQTPMCSSSTQKRKSNYIAMGISGKNPRFSNRNVSFAASDNRQIVRKSTFSNNPVSQNTLNSSISFLNSLLPPKQCRSEKNMTGNISPKSPILFSSDSEEDLNDEKSIQEQALLTPVLRSTVSNEEEPDSAFSTPKINSTQRNLSYIFGREHSPSTSSSKSLFDSSPRLSSIFSPKFPSESPTSTNHPNQMNNNQFFLSGSSFPEKETFGLNSEKTEIQFNDAVFGESRKSNLNEQELLQLLGEDRSLVIDTQNQSSM